MKKILIVVWFLFIMSSQLFGEEQREFNVALKVSSLGLGLDISTSINEIFSTRFNINSLNYSDKQSSDGNEFEGALELFTAGILLDYYPFENNFRLSSGIYYNGNGFTGSAKPSDKISVNIDGETYTAQDIGSLDSSISFNSIAPYLGLGWGNDVHDQGWGVTVDLGVLYHGTGRVDLNANLLNSSNILASQLEKDLRNAEKNINDELAKLKLYPVVAIGVNYTF